MAWQNLQNETCSCKPHQARNDSVAVVKNVATNGSEASDASTAHG